MLCNIIQHNYIAGMFSKTGGGERERKQKEHLKSTLVNFIRSMNFAGSQCDSDAYKKLLLNILSKEDRVRA